MGKMTATHPIPRLLALLVADVFFQRSSLFRTLMIGELNEFFELTLGISVTNRPLPPPAKSATYCVRIVPSTAWRSKLSIFISKVNALVISRQISARRGRTCVARLVPLVWRSISRHGASAQFSERCATVNACSDLIVLVRMVVWF